MLGGSVVGPGADVVGTFVESDGGGVWGDAVGSPVHGVGGVIEGNSIVVNSTSSVLRQSCGSNPLPGSNRLSTFIHVWMVIVGSSQRSTVQVSWTNTDSPKDNVALDGSKSFLDEVILASL